MVAVKKMCGKCGAYSVDEHDGYNDCIKALKRKIFAMRDESDDLRSELEQWRIGKRRVFWRTRNHTRPDDTIDWSYRSEAWILGRVGFPVLRVTVGPAKPKEAK